MSEKMWRFPDNNYTDEKGLDTSDMEIFKKDPIASLAREICQNSIDASYGEKPVKVEFSLFSVDREEIPGIDELAKQIEKCYEYKKDSPKEGSALTELKKSINKKTIKCLRISDFNTTGVIGANDYRSGQPFYSLTKGSGVSDKVGTSGGSKGIGKFASFVVSTTNTVFYSTKANDDSTGFIGISKLRSVPMPEVDEDLMTIGIGYYGKNKKNFPVLEELNLDKSFKREEKQYGTDVYLIGFNEDKAWKTDIIAKILESFMVAIMNEDLEVKVAEHLVKKSTVADIIYSEEFEKERTKTEVKQIRAQYELLQEDESVISEELTIDENNTVTVYVKQYAQQNESSATKHCVMVRYPYMKITYIRPGAFLPFSALCVIHDNPLNKKLRAIENPQHTDWEIKRLNDFPKEKKETRELKKRLENTVTEFINNVLRASGNESSDIEGAGEFLPSQDDIPGILGEPAMGEKIHVKTVTPVKVQTPKTEKAGEKGEGYDMTKGEQAEDGTEEGRPLKKRKKPTPNPNPEPKPEPKPNPPVKEGEKPILKKVPLSGMRYRTVVTDKNSGKYDCIFKSLYTENECELSIRQCGEAADKYPVEIMSASIDGVPCEVKEGKIIGIKIEKDKNYKISYKVNIDEMFASEVILNAIR